MKYLIAVDMEGIHGVVGKPYTPLTRGAQDYDVATKNAAKEINTVIKALFDGGAEAVGIWDNHGGGGNVAPEDIDARAVQISAKDDVLRYDFLKNYDFDKIIFLGYHAMEGTMGGVLAHTFSSVNIQYVRLNGKDIGELYTDSAIASDYGIAPIFIACDDICLKEMQRICPDIEYVITKYGEGRNRARLREGDTVLREMYDGVRRAMTKDRRTTGGIPKGSELEVRFTRAEYAEEIYEKTRCDGMIPVSYGGDTHTLKFTVDRANQIQKCL